MQKKIGTQFQLHTILQYHVKNDPYLSAIKITIHQCEQMVFHIVGAKCDLNWNMAYNCVGIWIPMVKGHGFCKLY
jgi:hypothetical protein